MQEQRDTQPADRHPALAGIGIVDAHVHLYDPGRTRYGWMAQVPALDRPHGPDAYWRDAAPLGIEGAICVEVNADPGEHLREARVISDWAGADRRLLGMVASAPLDRADPAGSEVAPLLASRGVVGLRTLIEPHADVPGWALAEPFVSAIRAVCGPDGPAFDLCIRARQLREVAALADACPETRFVLDHCGKPEIGGPDEARWRDDLAFLARRENVACKLSGLATEIVDGEVSTLRIAPFLEHALAVFGPERTMFASDWPICTLAMPLGDWVALVSSAAAPHGENAVRQVFRDTALGIYRIRSAVDG